jgi:hypothetical protein
MSTEQLVEEFRDKILGKVDKGEIKLNENDGLYGASLFMDAAIGDITIEEALEMFLEHSDYTISVREE